MQISETDKTIIQSFYREHGGYNKLFDVIGQKRADEGKQGYSYDYIWGVINGERESEYIWTMANKVMEALKKIQKAEQELLTETLNEKY